ARLAPRINDRRDKPDFSFLPVLSDLDIIIFLPIGNGSKRQTLRTSDGIIVHPKRNCNTKRVLQKPPPAAPKTGKTTNEFSERRGWTEAWFGWPLGSGGENMDSLSKGRARRVSDR